MSIRRKCKKCGNIEQFDKHLYEGMHKHDYREGKYNYCPKCGRHYDFKNIKIILNGVIVK